MSSIANNVVPATSGLGPMKPNAVAVPIVLNLAMVSGTSGFGAMGAPLLASTPARNDTVLHEERGAYHQRPDEQSSPASAINELRRLSGLTWERLAELFGTSRRALHFWASGKAMNADNEERLFRLLATVRHIDRGSAAANRAVLLSADETGTRPIDQLSLGDYDGTMKRLGRGDGRTAATTPPSADEMARRAPPPPDTLVEALTDRPYASSGALLGTTPVKHGDR